MTLYLESFNLYTCKCILTGDTCEECLEDIKEYKEIHRGCVNEKDDDDDDFHLNYACTCGCFMSTYGGYEYDNGDENETHHCPCHYQRMEDQYSQDYHDEAVYGNDICTHYESECICGCSHDTFCLDLLSNNEIENHPHRNCPCHKVRAEKYPDYRSSIEDYIKFIFEDMCEEEYNACGNKICCPLKHVLARGNLKLPRGFKNTCTTHKGEWGNGISCKFSINRFIKLEFPDLHGIIFPHDNKLTLQYPGFKLILPIE